MGDLWCVMRPLMFFISVRGTQLPSIMVSAAQVKREIGAMIKSGDLDKERLKEILKFHPRGVEKVGGFVDVDLNARKDGLIIIFENGHRDTINWKACVDSMINGRKPDHRSLCLQAMRHAVMEQAMAFRRVSGYEGDNDYHVGHNWEAGTSFVQLAELFVQDLRGWENLEIFKQCTVWKLKEPIRSQWQEFHRQNGDLRMELAKENMRAPH